MPAAQTRKRAAQNDRFEARISPEKKSLCQRAAIIRGSSLSDFVINSAVEAAERTIREVEFMDLTQRDRLAFVQALLNDAAAPNATLRKAAERYARMFPVR